MRHAAIDISPDVLGYVSVLGDCGLEITGSLQSDGLRPSIRVAVLDRDGTILPEECERNLWLVHVQLKQEAYGQQRMIRIDRFLLVKDLDAARLEAANECGVVERVAQ